MKSGDNITNIISSWTTAINDSAASNSSETFNSSSIAGEVDWTLVGRGMLVSMSQVISNWQFISQRLFRFD